MIKLFHLRIVCTAQFLHHTVLLVPSHCHQLHSSRFVEYVSCKVVFGGKIHDIMTVAESCFVFACFMWV
jgi:hypothetical protein